MIVVALLESHVHDVPAKLRSNFTFLSTQKIASKLPVCFGNLWNQFQTRVVFVADLLSSTSPRVN